MIGFSGTGKSVKSCARHGLREFNMIMKKYLFLFNFLFLLGAILLVSCDGEREIGDPTDSNQQIEASIKKLLVGTSWKTKSATFYDYNNKEVSSYDESKYPDVITFTDKKVNTYNDNMVLYVDYHKNHPYYDGYTTVSWWNVSGNNLGGNPGAGNCFGEILNISKTEIKTKYIGNWDNEWYRIDIYVPTNEPTHNFNQDDNQGGGSTMYEKPDVGFYDFTATKTSLKVQYKIYNKDEAGVTSAKIYYGTNSNPSLSKTATVSGVLITANISGLKAGTTYYVKCVATGKGGTTTTTTTKCMTNY